MGPGLIPVPRVPRVRQAGTGYLFYDSLFDGWDRITREFEKFIWNGVVS